MKVASVMTLYSGCESEYQRRHDELWPELAEHLRTSGISDYHIFLDAPSRQLFAVFEAPDDFDPDRVRRHPIMRRWWAYMADLMETRADSDEPQARALQEVFCFEGQEMSGSDRGTPQ